VAETAERSLGRTEHVERASTDIGPISLVARYEILHSSDEMIDIFGYSNITLV
jgi:hypothetical protein